MRKGNEVHSCSSCRCVELELLFVIRLSIVLVILLLLSGMIVCGGVNVGVIVGVSGVVLV